MTKAIDRPSTLFIMNVVLGVVSTLTVAVGALTINQAESEREYINSSFKEFKLVASDRIEKLTIKLDNSNNKINENQIIIHEMLTEMKWEKAQLNDLSSRVKELEKD